MESLLKQESRIAADKAMKEEATQVGGRRQLTHSSMSRCQRWRGVIPKALCSKR